LTTILESCTAVEANVSPKLPADQKGYLKFDVWTIVSIEDRKLNKEPEEQDHIFE
jgi:hypothetical protein